MPTHPRLDLQWVADTRVSPAAHLYTFPNSQAYLDAKNGVNRLSYTNFTQYFGLPNLEYNTTQYGVFIQDDWRVSPAFKLLYGLRYDFYTPPDSDPNAPVATSRDFPTSSNNIAPRVGAVWGLGETKRTVVRVNTGLMYDQTINAVYEQALQNDGTNARASATYTPTRLARRCSRRC
jgi:outer membrane receptor protein involved in Fe transport